MLRNLFIILVLTGCVSAYNSFKTEQELYPVFTIGYWYSSNSYIFEDSTVYQRGWTDATGLSGRFAAFNWKRLNDSTLKLTPITKFYKKTYPDGLTFRLYDKSKRCQLLIPIDSLDTFERGLQTDFDNTIVTYQFEPNDEEQELIDLDSAHLYSQLEQENFAKTLSLISTRLEKLGIWNGRGF
ncbi:MAG: hypothetical protein RLN88_06675 [Ekhidna sp.]|uniref:hypothetical protein n=1 Tax=Ekhidna sp. TaxID=2608089 RepID=UPI0032F01C61